MITVIAGVAVKDRKIFAAKRADDDNMGRLLGISGR